MVFYVLADGLANGAGIGSGRNAQVQLGRRGSGHGVDGLSHRGRGKAGHGNGRAGPHHVCHRGSALRVFGAHDFGALEQLRIAAEGLGRVFLALPVGAGIHAIDGGAAVFIRERIQRAHQRLHRIRGRAAELAGVHGRGQGIDLDLNLRAAAQGGGQGGLAHRGVAGIRNEDGIGSEKLRAILDELGQALTAALFRALDEVLEVHLGAAIGLQCTQGRQVHGHIALAVRCAAAVPAGGALGIGALGQGEGIGLPGRAVSCGHDVVVRVEQYGLGAFFALALAQNGGGAIGGLDGFYRCPGFFQRGLHPLAGALGLVFQARLIVHGIESHELAELAEDGVAVTAYAVNDICHAPHGTLPCAGHKVSHKLNGIGTRGGGGLEFSPSSRQVPSGGRREDG